MRVLTSLINIDQTGSMLGKSTDINLRAVFNYLQLPPDSHTRILVDLDIEKASVFWQNMKKVLEYFGNFL